MLLSPVAYNTLKFAQSQLAWLNDALSRTFEHTRENPFACRRAPTGSAPVSAAAAAEALGCKP